MVRLVVVAAAVAVAAASLTIVADAFTGGFSSTPRAGAPTSSRPAAAATALRMTATGPQEQQPQPQPRSERPASRRAAALQQLGLGAGVVVSGAWLGMGLGAPGAAEAKKITNLEEARERGEKKMEEIEKAKGPLIKLKDGVQYREELVGKGDGFEKGDLVKIRYQVYKGNGDYMFSTGYGREFQNDVGDTYDFTFGRPNSIPKGAEVGMEGMRVGGKRKILVPAALGWSTSGGLPEPQTFGGKRKLLNNVNQNLQMEIELIRVKKRGAGKVGASAAASE